MQESQKLRDQKRIEAIKLEARIRKLKVEEEKAKKRISDAKREQALVQDMKSTKNKWLGDKINNNSNLKNEEEYNRQRIHMERAA